MTTRQRLGLALMLIVISTRLDPGTIDAAWWDYVLIGLTSIGGVMLIAPPRV